MKHIFLHGFVMKNIGSKIKSPVELIVGLRRILPMQKNPPELQVYFSRLLSRHFIPQCCRLARGKTG
jgi:hypothetical protein